MCKLSIIAFAFLAFSGAVANDYNAKIFFFFGDSYDTHEIYDLDKAAEVMSHSSFNASKPIMLYSHGYFESAESDTVRAIVDAYIENGNYNILIIDWRELASGLIYPIVAASLEKLGFNVATLLLQYISQQYPIDQIHVVGHSLGGQLGGYIGRSVMSQSGGEKKLKRISALDPAGPSFFLIRINTKHITKDDAEFVDVIHTDAGILGYLLNTGTVDFWPNGGHRPQPGCNIFFDILCSHQRSVYIWAESVRKGSTVSFLSLNPRNTIPVQMGNNCPSSAAGTYILATNSASPYSLV